MPSKPANIQSPVSRRSSALADGWELQLHRDTYIGVLRGHLRKPGAKQEFAARAGITPQYLSYLLDPYNHRTPSPALARAIVNTLEMSDHERNHLLDHLLLANERQWTAHETIRQRARQGKLEPEEVQQQVIALKRFYEQVKYNPDPEQTRQQIAAVGQSARILLRGLDAWRSPVDYADIALIMHDLNTAIAHPSQALYYAKLARTVLNLADPGILHGYGLQRQHAFTNAIRSEAVSLYHLHLPRDAYKLLLETEETPDAQARPAFWLPHIYRDRLATLRLLPRATFAEAEGLAAQGVAQCEKLETDLAPLLSIFVERQLGDIYLRRGRITQAEELLRRLLQEMRQAKLFGVRHRIPLLMDLARVLWRQRALEEWHTVMVEAMTLIVQARMENTVKILHRRYPGALDAVLDQVDANIAAAAYGDDRIAG